MRYPVFVVALQIYFACRHHDVPAQHCGFRIRNFRAAGSTTGVIPNSVIFDCANRSHPVTKVRLREPGRSELDQRARTAYCAEVMIAPGRKWPRSCMLPGFRNRAVDNPAREAPLNNASFEPFPLRRSGILSSKEQNIVFAFASNSRKGRPATVQNGTMKYTAAHARAHSSLSQDIENTCDFFQVNMGLSTLEGPNPSPPRSLNPYILMKIFHSIICRAGVSARFHVRSLYKTFPNQRSPLCFLTTILVKW